MWASAQAWGVHVSESMRKVQKVSLQPYVLHSALHGALHGASLQSMRKVQKVSLQYVVHCIVHCIVQKVSLQYRGQCMVHYMVHCTLAEARLEKALHTKAILAMERLY